MSTIEELKFDKKNFNKHTAKGMGLLEKSLQQFGAGRSILVDKDNNIIAGNGIVEAAASAGITKTRVVETTGDELVVVKRNDVELDSLQGREMALADNATAAADLDWDGDNLRDELDEETLDKWDVDAGWADDVEVGEDEAPEIDEKSEPKSRLGEIYILGGHKLMCGDATKPEDMQKLTGGGSEMIDLWLTDPPYNVAIQGGNHGDPDRTGGLKIENDSKSDEEFRAFLDEAFNVAADSMKPGSAFYIFYASSEAYNFHGACRDANLGVKEVLVWKKDSLVMGRQDYQWKHEPAIYGWKPGAPHKWYSDRKQTTVLEFDRPTRSSDHPTMKPVELFAYLIKNSTKVGDIVLDSFGGSGTTLVACEQTGRKCLMMELDPRYCDVIRKRYWKLTHDGNEDGWEDGTKATNTARA